MHTFVICLQKEPLHIIIFHTLGGSWGSQRSKERKGSLPAQSSSEQTSGRLNSEAPEAVLMGHAPQGRPLQAAGMGRKVVQTRVARGPTTWTLTGQRQRHALLSQPLSQERLQAASYVTLRQTGCDSSAGMWLISLSKSPTLSLPIVFCLWGIKFSLLLIHQPGERRFWVFSHNGTRRRATYGSKITQDCPL